MMQGEGVTAMAERRMIYEVALTHPWWGVECPLCKAAPGRPCRGGKAEPDYATIHGQRTGARVLDWVDPRGPDDIEREAGQLTLQFTGT
jgi:hypothetical protein